MSDNEHGGEKKISKRIEIIVDEAREGLKSAFHSSGVESLGENIKEALEGALSGRENVVMVRLNDESLQRIDELIEAEVVSSRSEGVAFLVAEGVKAQAELFDKIKEKVEQIRQVKQELRDLLGETPAETDASATESKSSSD